LTFCGGGSLSAKDRLGCGAPAGAGRALGVDAVWMLPVEVADVDAEDVLELAATEDQ
jgi:hypothetical protein